MDACGDAGCSYTTGIMQSKATTVDQYMKQLPADRRTALEAVRKVVRKNLGKGYVEAMQYGMIGYQVPHSIYPAGYHCDPKQPLPFAGLASQKNHMSLYMMCCYGQPANEAMLRKGFAAAGKKLDMGKSCIRFRKVEDLALDVIGAAIKRVPVQDYLAWYEGAYGGLKKGAPAKKKPAAAKKAAPAAKKPAPAKKAPAAKAAPAAKGPAPAAKKPAPAAKKPAPAAKKPAPAAKKPAPAAKGARR